jgi:osmotically inducible protein OsmC
MQRIHQNLYTTTASSKGGRDGHVRTDDGQLDVAVKAPKDLGGPGGATNPEQLFAAGYAACFHSALTLVASTQGVDTTDSTVTASVKLGKDETGGYTLAVELTADLPGVDDETTERLLQRAHATCPYSRATQGNIEVTLRAG